MKPSWWFSAIRVFNGKNAGLSATIVLLSATIVLISTITGDGMCS